MSGSTILLEYTLAYYLVNIGRGKRYARVEASGYFGKIVLADDLSYRADVLLARYHYPRLALAYAPEVFRDRLEIEHKVGIVAYVLAYFINEEYDMMVVSLSVDVFFDHFSEILDRDVASTVIKSIAESTSTTSSWIKSKSFLDSLHG